MHYAVVRRRAIQNCTTPCNTMQYHAVQWNTKQYHAIQSNTLQHNQIQYNTIPCTTIKYNTIPCTTIKYNTIPCKTMKYHGIRWWWWWRLGPSLRLKGWTATHLTNLYRYTPPSRHSSILPWWSWFYITRPPLQHFDSFFHLFDDIFDKTV